MAIRIPFIVQRTIRIQMPVRWDPSDDVILSDGAVMYMAAEDGTETSGLGATTLGMLDPIANTNINDYTMTELSGS